ncbi:ABC transporter substrate-binding protein [Roseivivax sediminis]|uniref:Iron(III) transport system substrate-binding protein n=1 Tax=Roseivivax sediminis TaxID=936889 RepID=A0A1I1UB23_9RHOB|nr:ABC transporter substrate-binding protein [Roseivivax sediminis]SFD65963.1 iron(III) transport system substrate-binding protein [Roseivivax sediminis]
MIRRVILALTVVAGTCAGAQELTERIGATTAAQELRVRSTTDLDVLRPVLERFLDTRPGTAILYEQWLSNNLYRRSVTECEAGTPGADLVISSAVHQLVEFVNRACAASHVSEATARLPPRLSWRDELWGITREPAVIVYNRDLVPPEEVPRSRFDLLDILRNAPDRYAGRIATYDIEASGLGFLFAYADSLEATTFGGLLEAFGRTGAVATCCSAEIMAGVLNGDYLIAYNILGSYAFDLAEENPDLGIVAPSDYTLILARGAVVPRGARNYMMATQLVDFLVSTGTQDTLRRANLHIDLDALLEKGAVPDGTGASQLRAIELSPKLLVALDRHKRLLFKEVWQNAFSQD